MGQKQMKKYSLFGHVGAMPAEPGEYIWDVEKHAKMYERRLMDFLKAHPELDPRESRSS